MHDNTKPVRCVSKMCAGYCTLFCCCEKTYWKSRGLISPNGTRVYRQSDASCAAVPCKPSSRMDSSSVSSLCRPRARRFTKPSQGPFRTGPLVAIYYHFSLTCRLLGWLALQPGSLVNLVFPGAHRSCLHARLWLALQPGSLVNLVFPGAHRSCLHARLFF